MKVDGAIPQKSILIISSYNPSSRQTSSTISEFIDKYQEMGGTYNIMIENMNCKSFTDVNEWERILSGIFSKHTENRPPSLIILLGQEAWATFISLPEAQKPKCPIIVSMVSRNFIYLPKDNEHTQTWQPNSYDFFEEDDKIGRAHV